MADPAQKTSQSIIDELRTISQKDGDNFRCRVNRRATPNGPPTHIATFDNLTLEQLSSPELWLPPLLGDGGGVFDLVFFHVSDYTRQVGMPGIRWPKDGPPKDLNYAPFMDPGWNGPKLVYPDPVALKLKMEQQQNGPLFPQMPAGGFFPGSSGAQPTGVGFGSPVGPVWGQPQTGFSPQHDAEMRELKAALAAQAQMLADERKAREAAERKAEAERTDRRAAEERAERKLEAERMEARHQADVARHEQQMKEMREEFARSRVVPAPVDPAAGVKEVMGQAIPLLQMYIDSQKEGRKADAAAKAEVDKAKIAADVEMAKIALDRDKMSADARKEASAENSKLLDRVITKSSENPDLQAMGMIGEMAKTTMSVLHAATELQPAGAAETPGWQVMAKEIGRSISSGIGLLGKQAEERAELIKLERQRIAKMGGQTRKPRREQRQVPAGEIAPPHEDEKPREYGAGDGPLDADPVEDIVLLVKGGTPPPQVVARFIANIDHPKVKAALAKHEGNVVPLFEEHLTAWAMGDMVPRSAYIREVLMLLNQRIVEKGLGNKVKPIGEEPAKPEIQPPHEASVEVLPPEEPAGPHDPDEPEEEEEEEDESDAD